MNQLDPRLYRHPGLRGARRRQAAAILEAALAAVDPAEAVRRTLRLHDGLLAAGEESYALDEFDHIYVVGAGKAGAPMAQAVEELLGARITAGSVTVKYGYTAPTRQVRLVEAGHPVPDEAGMRGAAAILELLERATPRDLVLVLISGGGSALLPAPLPGTTLADLQALTNQLLRAGATITEINCVRKHLDALKGGRLALKANGARVLALVLSDIVGNPLDMIASGPTTADATTFTDALAILGRYRLLEGAPAPLLDALRRGADGAIAETLKPGAPELRRVQNLVIASNEIAAAAAESAAVAAGFHTLLLTTYLEGEAREAARVLASLAKSIRADGRPLTCPACILCGGETTVTVRGEGRGGRNQELALAAALSLEGLDDVMLASLATDGSDGPTDAAGALVEGDTIARARALGLDPYDYLARNDSYAFFTALGDLLLTGPTNTNVNDLVGIWVW